MLYNVQSQIVGSGSVTAGVIMNDKDMVVHALQSTLISADTVPIIVAIACRIVAWSSPSAHNQRMGMRSSVLWFSYRSQSRVE